MCQGPALKEVVGLLVKFKQSFCLVKLCEGCHKFIGSVKKFRNETFQAGEGEKKGGGYPPLTELFNKSLGFINPMNDAWSLGQKMILLPSFPALSAANAASGVFLLAPVIGEKLAELGEKPAATREEESENIKKLFSLINKVALLAVSALFLLSSFSVFTASTSTLVISGFVAQLFSALEFFYEKVGTEVPVIIEK